MRKLVLHSYQSPGDIVMLTAAVRDLHAAAPGQFLTDVRTSADGLFEHNPYITRLNDTDPHVERIDMHYPLIHESNQRPVHFLEGYVQHLERVLNIPRIPVSRFQGDIHLSDEERANVPLTGLPDRFWILIAGGKFDFTAKWWNPAHYQAVVDHFQGRITFVQCGEIGHWHQPVRGVIDARGKTSLRQFVQLMHHADGVVCPVTFAMHLAAAVPSKPGKPKHRPCVVIAGGREPPHWEAYPHHQFLHSVGQLSCCADGGCWKSRCQTVGDGDAKDVHDLCVQPVQITPELRIPRCMEMITPMDVIRAIERYLDGGIFSSAPTPSRVSEPSLIPAVVTPYFPQNGQGGNGHSRVPAAFVPPKVFRSRNQAPCCGGNALAEALWELPARSEIAFRFPHGLRAAMQFTTVLRHLAKERPEWGIDVWSRRGFQGVFQGLCRCPALERDPAVQSNGYAKVLESPWTPPTTAFANVPSHPAIEYLVNQLGFPADPALCTYELATSEAVRAEVAVELARVCQADPMDGRYPVVLIHPQGKSNPNDKNLSEETTAAICRIVQAEGLTPVILDFEKRNPLVQQLGLTSPGYGSWRWDHHDIEHFAALIEQVALFIGVNSGPLHVAAGTKTPSLAIWTGQFPGEQMNPGDTTTHFVPLHWRQIGLATNPTAADVFLTRYQYLVYDRLLPTLEPEIAKAAATFRVGILPNRVNRSEIDEPPHVVPVETEQICVPVENPVEVRMEQTPLPVESPTAQITPTFTTAVSRLPVTTVRFEHGLGDCAYFAHLIQMYIRRGFPIAVACSPDKRILFEAAGASVVPLDTPASTHDWGYPAGGTHAGQGQFWRGSKIANNISASPLPAIGSPAELWDELCSERIDIRPRLAADDIAVVNRWLDRLTPPVILLHTKGNTGQERKSLPDTLTIEFYKSLLDQTDGSIILLDWDNRVPRLASHRLRHLTDLGPCSLDRLLVLQSAADLMVGVDSGPLHVARFTSTRSVGLWMPGHYPTTYTLPRAEQLNVVLADHTREWNRFKRVPWNIVEHPGSQFSPDRLAAFCQQMLAPPRYLNTSHQASDVQLQQWIREWCRCSLGNGLASYADRHRSFDRLFQEISRRFESPTVVETGCIRGEEDFGGAGFFTYLCGAYLRQAGGVLHSVDLNPQHTQFARDWTAIFGSAVRIHTGDSIEFLGRFTEPIDVLYLDSLDTTEPGHAEHCEREFDAAASRLHAQSIVAVDDTPWNAGAFTGKGARLVPRLINSGWRILYAGYQVVLSRE